MQFIGELEELGNKSVAAKLEISPVHTIEMGGGTNTCYTKIEKKNYILIKRIIYFYMHIDIFLHGRF